MPEELLDAMGLVCRDRLVAAVGVEPGRLPESARAALTSVARLGAGAVDRVVELVELAREAAVDEVEALMDYPLFRADESVTVTVTVGELVDYGLPADAIGVGWVDRDECRGHALAGAAGRPVADRNVRGIVLWEGMGLDCGTCRDEAPAATETAQIAMEAAMTGHLVLTTLHAESAAAALVRLRELGVPAATIASSLRLVLSQRLLRKICDVCRNVSEGSWRGCPDCGFSGYRGRIAAYEALELDDDVRAIVGSGSDELAPLVGRHVPTTIRRRADELAASGVTTDAEVVRVCGETRDSSLSSR
jgi:type II/IV secretion system protein